MSDRERHMFEREMEIDPFLKDAVEGYEQINPDEIKASLQEIEKKFNKQKSGIILPVWIRIAAISLLTIGISILIFINTIQNEKLLSKNQEKAFDNPTKFSEPIENNDITIEEEVIVPITMEERNTTTAESKIAESNSPVKPQPLHSLSSSTTDNTSLYKKNAIKSHILRTDSETTTHKSIKGRIAAATITSNKTRTSRESYILDGTKKITPDSFIQVKGKVIDENGKPLPVVSVFDTQSSTATVTNKEGDFKITVPKNEEHNIKVDYLGHKKKRITIDKDSIGDIVLESDIFAMQELIGVEYQKKEKHSINDIESSEAIQSDEILEPETPPKPPINIKRYIRKIENSLKNSFPNSNHENKKVEVELIISNTGEVTHIEMITQTEIRFEKLLKDKIIEMGKWEPAKLKNNNIKSSRTLIFNFQ